MAEIIPTTRMQPAALGQSIGQSLAGQPMTAPPVVAAIPTQQQQTLAHHHPPSEMLPSTRAQTPLHHPHETGDVAAKIHHQTPLNTAASPIKSALHHPPQPTHHAIVPATNRQLMRGDRHMFSSSDETGMMKQIMAYHVPDGRDFDVKPLLLIVEDIMQRAKPSFPTISVHIYTYIYCININYNGSQM